MNVRPLLELLHGRGAHADSVGCVRGLSVEEAGRTVAGLPHTIWQLLWHMNFWIRYDLDRIAGQAAPYPEHASASWPPPRPEDAAAWEGEVRRFALLLDEIATLARFGPDVLSRHVAATHPSHESKDATVYGVLWQIVAHDSYHLGQIADVRRALGAWPPPGGGDTW